MAYILLPNTGQSLGQTRAAVRENFNLLQTTINANHVDVSSGDGKHKFLQMPEQGSAPATLANEAGFYSKVGVSPAESNLFFRGENNGFEYQLTKAIAASTAKLGTNTALPAAPVVSKTGTGGWSFIPGAMLLQYGVVTGMSASGSYTFNFPIPFNSAPYTVILQPVRSSTSNVDQVYVNTVVTTGATIVNTSSSIGSVYFVAIGV